MSFNEVENQQQIELDATENQTSNSCGAILFEERKRQNLTIDYISSQINLSELQIRALESDKYDILASSSYVKGYIRLYANLLDLDVDEVMQYFKEPEQQQHASLSSIGQGIHKTKRASGANIAGFILLVLVLVGLGSFVWFISGVQKQASDNAESVEVETELKTSNNELAEISEPEVETVQVVTGAVTPVDKSVPVNSSKHRLTMSFRDSAWVEVIDENDKQVVNKRYQVGEKLSAYIEPPVRIFISNVDAVNMQFNEANYDLAPHKQGTFAKFTLSKP